ncbi:MAG: four helix bundle protein [Clostridia bacterium]|nr:four helix bundle protein [Clostridia bacterium]
MNENKLINLSKEFAVNIINLCDNLIKDGNRFALSNQLLRCGTSIGANIHEANYGSSRADFINKLQIALKECYETDYWLTILHDSKILDDECFKNQYDKCCQIRRILISSINTAKQNSK